MSFKNFCLAAILSSKKPAKVIATEIATAELIIRLTTDDYEYITTPNEEEHDEFAPLPKGTEGTIIDLPTEYEKGGYYVEFPYIHDHHPDADPVVWVTFDEMEFVKSIEDTQPRED